MRSRAAWSAGFPRISIVPAVGAQDVRAPCAASSSCRPRSARAARRRCSAGTSRERSATATWPAKAFRIPLRTMALSFMEPPGPRTKAHGPSGLAVRRHPEKPYEGASRGFPGCAHPRREDSILSAVPASPRDETRGLALVALSTLAYSVLPILGKIAYAAGVRPLPLLAWRYVVAAALIAILERGPRPPLRERAAAVGDRLRVRPQLDRLLPRPRGDPGVGDRARPVHLPRDRAAPRRARRRRAVHLARPPRDARRLRGLRAHRRGAPRRGRRCGSPASPGRSSRRSSTPRTSSSAAASAPASPRASWRSTSRRRRPSSAWPSGSPTEASPCRSTRAACWPSPGSASSRRWWP